MSDWLPSASRPSRHGFSYPADLEEHVALPNGRSFLLRPVRPADAPAFHAGFARLDPEDVRMRFFAPLGRLTPEVAKRLMDIDYDREMALVAAAPGADGREELFGVVRLIADPGGHDAEFAIIVDSTLKGQGLARLLMDRIVAYARRRGFNRLHGDVLRENRRMLNFAKELGFVRAPHPEDKSAVRVILTL